MKRTIFTSILLLFTLINVNSRTNWTVTVENGDPYRNGTSVFTIISNNNNCPMTCLAGWYDGNSLVYPFNEKCNTKTGSGFTLVDNENDTLTLIATDFEVRSYDPPGMDVCQIDVCQLDEKGNVINTITHDADGNRLTYDRIEVHNGDGQVLGQTSDFELGTIQYSKVTVGTGDKAWSYDQFIVNGTDNATSVFQTVADNTKVEWSHGIFGEGSEKSNFLTTTHNEWNEGGMRDVWVKQYLNGVPIVSHTHNHPTHNGYAPYPSGLPENNRFGSGDISFSKTITDFTKKISKMTPTFQIYDPKTKTFIPYGSNSVKSDFKYFNKKLFAELKIR